MTPEPINPLTRLPEDLHREFILPGATFADVLACAAGILKAASHRSAPNPPIGLFTENKTLIAAGLLAAACSDLVLVVPYALSDPVLREIRDIFGIRQAITDLSDHLPPDIQPLTFQPSDDLTAIFQGQFDPDKLLLKLFTGGSTGTPQVWSKTNRNLWAEAAYQARRFGVTRDDRFLATVPGYHIYGLLFSVMVPLMAGAAVCREVLTFPREIIDGISRHRATILVSVPMHYRVLCGQVFPQTRLRLALSSAGPLDPRDGACFSAQTGVDLVEVYGSTETGGIATRCRNQGQISLVPFETVDWKIENDRLLVRSDFLSPELPKNAQGYFKTGDCAQIAPTGGFALKGRADGIAKVGGKRVDLEMVRDRIKAIKGVGDAIVISLDDTGGRDQMICALVAGTVDETHIRHELAKDLEPYAVPRRIKVLDAIPATSTGKVDRQAVLREFGSG